MTVLVSVIHGGAEGAHGGAGTYPCVWNDSTFLKMNNHPLRGSSETSQEECLAPCTESYKAKWRGTALTAKGLQFPRCVTTTLLRCSDSTLTQDEKFEALDRTNSKAGEICVVGCSLGSELVSGDSLRTPTCVSKNESVDCLTASLTNPGQNEVSEDGENITCSASCQAACAVGFVSANHPEPSGLATGQLKSDSVPSDPMCKEKKCVDAATSDSSVVAPECTDWKSGDQGKVMCTVGYTGDASTLTCTLDVVNGSVSLIGSLPNCSAALCAVDGIPSGASHDCGGIAFSGILLCQLFRRLCARRCHIFCLVLRI